MPSMNMGEGLGVNLGLDAPKYTRGYDRGELMSIDLGDMWHKVKLASRHVDVDDIISELEPLGEELLWRARDGEDVNEDDLERARTLTKQATRRASSAKAKVTRAANAEAKRRRLARVARNTSGRVVLRGERWLPLLWLRKDWRARLSATPTAGDTVREIVVVDASVPIAFVRVAVYEEGEKVRCRRPKWREDPNGRQYLVTPTTLAVVRRLVGAPAPQAVRASQALQAVAVCVACADKRWQPGAEPSHVEARRGRRPRATGTKRTKGSKVTQYATAPGGCRTTQSRQGQTVRTKARTCVTRAELSTITHDEPKGDIGDALLKEMFAKPTPKGPGKVIVRRRKRDDS